jgi:DNA-binding beta-propeller fold protein YncE
MRLPTFTAAVAACAFAMLPRPARAVPPPHNVKAKYLYDVSDNTGTVGSSWANLTYDAEHKELYVVDQHDATVGIFNDVGMEIYRFGDDAEMGTIVGIDVMEGGDLLTLSMDQGKPVLHRCNFRGDPKQRIELSKVPPDFGKDFAPETVAFRGGKLYLAQRGSMKVLIADASGACLEAHDYFHELGLDKLRDLRAGSPGMRAFTVAADGTMLFTVAPMFKVFVIGPDGKASSFGQRGGAPGKFNITGAAVRDEHGRIFVSDILKCAVLVFDDKFEFLGQFGQRGWDPGDLIAPFDLAVADGKLFVSQSGGRGVSVYEISIQEPAPEKTAAQ